MYYIFCIFLLIIIDSVKVNGMVSHENREKFEKTSHEIMEKCKKETGATEDHLENLHDPSTVLSRETKCTIACFIRESGIKIEGDDIVDKFGFSKIIKDEDPESYKMTLTIAKECETEVPKVEDECEYSGSIFKCHMKKAEETGIKM